MTTGPNRGRGVGEPSESPSSHAGPGSDATLHDGLDRLAENLEAMSRRVGREGASLAATYLGGAAGNVRHALAALPRVRRTPSVTEHRERIARSTLIYADGRPVEAHACRHRVELRTDAYCLAAPTAAVEDGVWFRRETARPAMGRRGVLVRRNRELWFEDMPDHDEEVPPLDRQRSLWRDVFDSSAVRSRLRGPVFKALLISALAENSWLHLETGSRWWCDRVEADLMTSVAGGTIRDADVPDRRLTGVVDLAILGWIESLGWRLVHTPGLEGC